MKDRFCLRKRSAPRGPHVITYSATLDVPADTATLLTELLVAERLRRGTGVGSRAASCSAQAVLVLRWFREDADMRVLAADTGISLATGYRYLHEGIDVLAAQAPDLHQVLAAGAAAGWTHVTLDGTLIRTDRCRTVNPRAVAKSPYTRLTSSNGPVDRLAPRVVRGRGADRLTVTSL